MLKIHIGTVLLHIHMFSVYKSIYVLSKDLIRIFYSRNLDQNTQFES